MSKGLSFSRKTWRIIFGITLLLLTICAINPTFQNDTFYIIKLGEQIFDSGIDLNDHWAWSAPLINTYPHFLLNIIFAALYRAFGFTGVYVFTVVVGYLFSLSLYFMTEKVYNSAIGEKDSTLYPLVGIFVSVVILITFPTFIIARSQLLSFPLWLWEAWFILRFLNTGLKRYGAGICVIAWLCALIHATAWYFTFILFVPFFAAAYLSRLKKHLTSKNLNFNTFLRLDNIVFSNETECRNTRKLWVVMLASYATGLLTPTRLCYSSIFKAYNGNTVTYINEHKPLVLANMKYVLVSVILLAVLLVFFKVKCRLDLLFIFSGTLIMSIGSRRHVGLFVFLGWFALFFLVFGALKYIPEGFRTQIEKTVIPILTVIVIAVVGVANNRLFDFTYLSPVYASDEAIDFLKENYDVQNLRLYNDYSFGAYMLFRDVPVFMDSRVNEYTKQFNPKLERDVYDDYVSLHMLKSDWRDVVDYYDFDGYYISKYSELYQILSSSPDVEPVWEDDIMIIYMTVRNV